MPHPIEIKSTGHSVDEAEVTMPEFQSKMPVSIFHHPALGDLYDRLAMQTYAVDYLDKGIQDGKIAFTHGSNQKKNELRLAVESVISNLSKGGEVACAQAVDALIAALEKDKKSHSPEVGLESLG